MIVGSASLREGRAANRNVDAWAKEPLIPTHAKTVATVPEAASLHHAAMTALDGSIAKRSKVDDDVPSKLPPTENCGGQRRFWASTQNGDDHPPPARVVVV